MPERHDSEEPADRESDPLSRLAATDPREVESDPLRRIIALHRAGLAVVAQLDPQRICAAFIHELESLLPYERSLVAVLDSDSGQIDVLAHAARNLEESQAERHRIAALIQDNPNGVVRWVIENARPARIDDTHTDARYLEGSSRMRSELCVPIMRSDRVIGAINVECAAPSAFSDLDQIILAAMATSVAVALENATLFRNLEHELAERNRAEAALAESESRYRSLVENAEEGILVLFDDIVEFANERAQTLLAISPVQLVGHSFCELVEPTTRRRIRRALDKVFTHGGSRRVDAAQLHRVEGRWVDVAISRVQWGGAAAALCFLSDVTEAEKLTRRLGYQASHDALTGLVNRREFESRIEKTLRDGGTRGMEPVMCYLDLDQFKIINDSCGHSAGDALLIMLSQRIGEFMGEGDTLARLGGDEFGILLQHCGIDRAISVAMKIDKMVREFRFVWDDRDYAIGVSIGLVVLDNTQSTVSSVFRDADAACYLAKDEGRGRIRVYREDDDTVARRSTAMQWISRVRRALAEERLVLYCQPILDLRSAAGGERFEVLLRLKQEDGSIVLPDAFLPAVEHYDLSTGVDRYVVEHVMQWLSRNPRRVQSMDLCSINLSARSLGDVSLLDAIAAAISSSGVPGRKICFEITETGAIRDMHASVNFMRALGELGCRFALDDFGAGLSSFGYLRELPVEVLKVDGVFVSGLPEDATSVALVSAIQNLAETLGMVTVAEFASTPSIVEALTQIGVDFAQGYAISKPFPLERLQDP